jgi:hypothetical protein
MLKKRSIVGLLSVLVIFLTVSYSYYSLIPHKISDDNTPKTEFSTGRAMEYLKNMTDTYHFVGTPYHEKVKVYIIDELNKMGLKTDVQTQFSYNDKWRGATVNQNILARIKGRKKGKALMVLSHYDSAPFASRGASDDGVGVATILEGIRAYLATGKIPKHDIIILISDGEEIGLNGAKAFVSHHPWAKGVGLVINFEARGSGGPSYTLMETNGGNKQMVKEFVKANPEYPIANSFLYSVYKMLPNDTDLTMFREIGDIDGYNFAFIDDFYDYHSKTDNYNNVDINTVQHQGDYLMSLMNYFSEKDLDNFKSREDYVFFNFPLFKMIYYPFAWVIPLFFIALLIVIVLVVLGIKKGKINLKKALLGFVPFLIVLIVSILVSILGWKFILMIHPGYKDILQGFPYNGHSYIAGFVLLTLLITFWTYRQFWKKINLLEVMFAPIVFWLVISGVFAYILPGASFLIIPLYMIIIVYVVEIFFYIKKDLRIALFTLLSIPPLLIVSPYIDMFPVGLKMVSMPVSIVFTVLLFALVFPVLKNLYFRREMSILTLIITILVFTMAEAESGFDENHPKPNSLNYVYYADEGAAYWETYSNVLDPWLQGIMGKNIRKGSHGKGDMMSKFKSAVTYHSKAKKIDIPIPEITKIQEIVIDGYMNMEFIIKPKRKVNRMDIVTKDDVDFKKLYINRVPASKRNLNFTADKNRILSYYFTDFNDSLDIRFVYDPLQKPEILIYESSYDLIGNKIYGVPQRPKGYIPMPFILNDLVIVVKKLEM